MEKNYVSLNYAGEMLSWVFSLEQSTEDTEEYTYLLRNIELRKKYLESNGRPYTEIESAKAAGTIEKSVKYVRVAHVQALVRLMELRHYYATTNTGYYGKHEKYDRKVKRTEQWLLKHTKA